MTNSSLIDYSKTTEEKVRTLASLIYDAWDGDVDEICTDYAYLVTEGGKNNLLDKYIAIWREQIESRDEDEDEYEDEDEDEE